MLNCTGACFLRKTQSFFACTEGPPCFPEQGTQIATNFTFLPRLWSTLCGFCASPQKRPRTNGDILLLRCPRTSHTYTNAIQFVSVLGPSGCEVLGVGPCTNGTQRFGRVCAHPCLPLFRENPNYQWAALFQKAVFFFAVFGDLENSCTIGVHFSAWAILTLFAMILRFWGVENNTTGISVQGSIGVALNCLTLAFMMFFTRTALVNGRDIKKRREDGDFPPAFCSLCMICGGVRKHHVFCSIYWGAGHNCTVGRCDFITNASYLTNATGTR